MNKLQQLKEDYRRKDKEATDMFNSISGSGDLVKMGRLQAKIGLYREFVRKLGKLMPEETKDK